MKTEKEILERMDWLERQQKDTGVNLKSEIFALKRALVAKQELEMVQTIEGIADDLLCEDTKENASKLISIYLWVLA